MRCLLVAVLALCLAGSSLAVQDPTSNTRDSAPVKGQGDGALGPRNGGETIETATTILVLPYADTGATCGYAHDYTDCVYNAGAPDVVYAYTPDMNTAMTISLCGSTYDTAVWVYAGGVGNTVACNDDFCDLQSEVADIPVTAGVTYYIVVSGYGTACGTYTLRVWDFVGDCFCAPGLPPEGEPPCSDNYVDNYNGGCNSTGWTVIAGDAGGNASICGLSGTYLYNGSNYRDTDWYDITGNGQVVDFQCWAEFPLQAIFIYGTDCQNLQYDLAQVGICRTADLPRYLDPGVHAWLWVGPSVFTGVPCGSGYGNQYTMQITGLQPAGQATGACCNTTTGDCAMTTQDDCPPPNNWLGPGVQCTPENPCPPVPVERTTWGRIKSQHR